MNKYYHCWTQLPARPQLELKVDGSIIQATVGVWEALFVLNENEIHKTEFQFLLDCPNSDLLRNTKTPELITTVVPKSFLMSSEIHHFRMAITSDNSLARIGDLSDLLQGGPPVLTLSGSDIDNYFASLREIGRRRTICENYELLETIPDEIKLTCRRYRETGPMQQVVHRAWSFNFTT